ncbi:cytochrome P450 [Laetiporus sulphureus 93-53]|uniref:Cytochrome P450 n=1 Tax=Laetiporus sulphureus 93-53 TaxID=1314785 RepID=A0A165G273_9APHY|nr:cytochrome P450 [Laetiporus sulphureus 93-53]KZT09729.1 cytochrome P450 [Laetiporus sulphureus 93-53]
MNARLALVLCEFLFIASTAIPDIWYNSQGKQRLYDHLRECASWGIEMALARWATTKRNVSEAIRRMPARYLFLVKKWRIYDMWLGPEMLMMTACWWLTVAVNLLCCEKIHLTWALQAFKCTRQREVHVFIADADVRQSAHARCYRWKHAAIMCASTVRVALFETDMAFPPGPSYLARTLTIFSIAPAAMVILIRLLNQNTDLAIPAWLTAILAFLSIPVRGIIAVQANWDYKAQIADSSIRLAIICQFAGDSVSEKFDEFAPTFRLNILWDQDILTCDPAVIKTVLATEFHNYEKGALFKEPMTSLLGTGVFNSDGEMWKWHRAMTRPFFSKGRISHFELFNRHSEEALAKMNECFRAGYAVDFQELILRFTLDSATEFLFDSWELDRADAFARALANVQHVISERAQLGEISPVFEIRKNKADEYMRVVDDYVGPILQEALRKKEQMIKDGKWGKERDEAVEDDDSLLDHLIRYTSGPVVLHDEVLNILIAGRDTIAASLTFAVYFLCVYPAVLKRLRSEILEKVGPRQKPTYANVKEMKFLRVFIKETLRLYPAVPFNMRVSYSVFAMHRRTEYWGPDGGYRAIVRIGIPNRRIHVAQEFDPDRFLDERVTKYLTPNPFIFLPFNAGPRICLGQQFAYNEMSFFLIKLLQHFSAMELVPEAAPQDSQPPREWAGLPGSKGVEKIWPKTHLTLYANGGLWVRMTETPQYELDSIEM